MRAGTIPATKGALEHIDAARRRFNIQFFAATNQGKLDEIRIEMCWVFVDGFECGWTQGGITISGSSETTGVEVDQETDPIINVITGTTTEITVPFTQWNFRNLQLAFPGSEIRGTGNDQYLAVGSASGTQSHTLRLHPKDKDDDDFSEDIFFTNVTVSSDLDISITKGELQLLNVTFNAGPGSPPIAEVRGDKFYIGRLPASARVAVESIAVTPTTLTLTVDAEEKLTTEILPENATVKTVTWESDDEAVAMVDDQGTVYAIGAGAANVTATTKDGAKVATCAVTVTA